MSASRFLPLLVLLLLALPAAPEAEPPPVPEALPPAVLRAAGALGVDPEDVSVFVADLADGSVRARWRADAPRVPASTLKLVTTFAALEGLTPAHRWRTEAWALGPVRDGVLDGDLLLRGTGDPWLVAEEFWKFLRGIRGAGIRRITGDLVVDGSAFALPEEDPGAFDGQPDRIYNLVPHPLLVNFTAVRFAFSPDPGGERVRVRTDPVLANLEIVNRLGLERRSCGGYQRGVAVHVEDERRRDRVLLEGRFPTDCERYMLTRSVLRPESYAWGLFRLYWSQLGGSFEGGFRKGALPPEFVTEDPRTGRPVAPDGDHLLHVHESRPLGDVVRLVNKYSNNVMTRHLFLTLGAERFGGPADREKGDRALREALAAQGIDTTGLVVDNPSGLTRAARISARQLGELLLAAWRSPYMPEFVSSLALSGLDGTISDRFAGAPEQGRMHLKTGTLDDVSAIAGYVQTHGDRRRAVVVLVNGPDAHRGLGEEVQDALLSWVFRD